MPTKPMNLQLKIELKKKLLFTIEKLMFKMCTLSPV